MCTEADGIYVVGGLNSREDAIDSRWTALSRRSRIATSEASHARTSD